jgi:hypothetical protein
MIARGTSSTIQRTSSAVLLRMSAAALSPAVSPGGRHVGECMSLAMTWAYPERSSWVAARSGRGPFSPEMLPAVS